MDTQREQRHLYIKNTQRSSRKMCMKNQKDPSVALGPPKMASQNDGARARSLDRCIVVYDRVVEPDAGVPGHVGPAKQLHSGTGYNLVITSEGKIYGTRTPFDKEAIMVVTAKEGGEVQIQAQKSKYFVAMDEKGKVYPEENRSSPNTWFKEFYEDGWNYYVWTGNPKQQWFLGINKSGKMKPGYKTNKKQKSVKFVPRTATPPYD